MIIQHEAFIELYNKDDEIFNRIFNNVNDFKTFLNNIKKESKYYEKYNYKKRKLIGDLFEIFGELFFKILGPDNRVGFYNYKPVEGNLDFGVDGYGIGIDNNIATVQIKYRDKTNNLLNQDDLKQYVSQSLIDYEVDKNTKTNLIVFTNSKGVHPLSNKDVFKNRLRNINGENIKNLVNNNYPFWNNVRDIIKKTIEENYE